MHRAGCRCDICRRMWNDRQNDYRRKNPDVGKTEDRICEKCGTQFKSKPAYKSRPRVGRFCSQTCSGTKPGSGKRPSKYRPGHPLANSDGRILAYRLTLYERIGPGPHPCHWCGDELQWIARVGRESSGKADLLADHLDGDPTNSASDNLVPSCHACNVLRGSIALWERRTGKDAAILNAHNTLNSLKF
jgi:hypothetical protein